MPRRIPPADPRRAVAYLRVSTEDQHLGPEAQRAAIDAWAQREGVVVVAWHLDQGVSGGAALDRRPGLLAAVDELGALGAGRLVVAKRDRLARDVVLAAQIESLTHRAGARVVSAAGEGEGDDPSAALMRRLVDAFAEYERALIKARTKAALAVKKRRGERTGTVPFGYRVAVAGPVLERDDAEQATVLVVRELAAEGYSQRGIVAELDHRGHVSRVGTPLTRTQVSRLLARAFAAAAAE